LRRAKPRNHGRGGKAVELDRVVNMRGDLAQNLFALGERDGSETAAEVGKKIADKELVGLHVRSHWVTSSGSSTGSRSWVRPLEKSIQAAAIRRSRSRPASVSE